MTSKRSESPNHSTIGDRERDYHNNSSNLPYTWRDGFKQRVIKQSTTHYSLPEFAVVPKQRISESYFEIYRDESQILKTLRIYDRLRDKLMVVFGREPTAPDCSTEVFDNPSVSKNHAAILYTKEGLMIFDLYSRSGTFVNDYKIKPGVCEPIFDGDVIRLGTCSRVLRLKNTNSPRPEAEKHFLRVAKEKFESGKLDRTNMQQPEKEIACSHILLKHTKSRRPVCAKGPVTRTIDEARTELKKILDDLRANFSPQRFHDIAVQVSECSSAARGGALGYFTYKTMQPAFSDAAFALQVGEMSDLVESDSGIHIILRTA